MAEEKTKKKFFIAKVNNFVSFRRAAQTSQWACSDKTIPPQPRDILSEAFSHGKVVIIFSVSNCHGWHGYAEMLNIPRVLQTSEVTSDLDVSLNETDISSAPQNKSVSEDRVKTEVSNSSIEPSACNAFTEATSSFEKKTKFYYFDVKWKLNYLEFGEQCLNSKSTENFTCIEKPGGDKIPLNKCRNWQEVDSDVGESVCEEMHKLYDSLYRKREEKIQRKIECQAEPFYKETNLLTVKETWKKIVSHVEQNLGKVILACPFGSQRYNLQIENSDTDMFIVYQAKTRDVLSFHPPKQTIKNRENEACDYTIHEVYRYCELLLTGDARCVETLFLHESTVVQASPEWHILKQGRKLFLNMECLDKYLRDAQGSKGTKYLQKWCKENPDTRILPAKMCKMLYVIVRLLQNASNIVNGEDLVVYRESGSAERGILMKIRTGNVPVQDAWKYINELETCINLKSNSVARRGKDTEEFLENWLLTLRYENFQPSSFNSLTKT